jgi:bile acid:Na+ symporter, BASS family
MFLMDPLTKALSYVFLAGSMLGIGLKVGKDDILAVLRDRSWLVRVVIANFVLIPASGILAARALAMKPENALALIVLACAPGGMSALQYLSKKQGTAALAYGSGTTVLLTFLSIFLTPALIALAMPGGLSLTVPYGSAILFVALFMLLPLVLGTLVHHLARTAAGRLSGPVSLIATLAFIGAMVKMLNITKWAKGEMGTKGLVAIVAFILISMLIGWLLGGPRKWTRPILATSSSMRNIALALAIAIRSFDDPAVLTPLVAFMAIMVPMNLLYMLVAKAAAKKAAKAAAAS